MSTTRALLKPKAKNEVFCVYDQKYTLFSKKLKEGTKAQKTDAGKPSWHSTDHNYPT
jgi:hypothetical protein